MKYWEIIADNLKKDGWSLGWVSTIDPEGRTIWIADAHRGDGKRFVVRADENLTAFLELESVLRFSATKELICPLFAQFGPVDPERRFGRSHKLAKGRSSHIVFIGAYQSPSFPTTYVLALVNSHYNSPVFQSS